MKNGLEGLKEPLLKINGAQIITNSLRMEGVDTIFTLAGDHILPLLDILDDEGFTLIDCRHEQAAVHMAETWARMTGNLGVVAVTTPGHANAIPGLINAMSTESPILNIAGSSDLRNYHRGIMQEIDQVGIARTVTKGAWLAHDPRRIPDLMTTAIRTAFEGRRGPVHLTVPVDVQSAEVEENEVTFYQADTYKRVTPITASNDSIVKAIQILNNAARPIIVASTPSSYGDWTKIYEKFIETTRIPFMTEEAARGIVSDEHPFCFGFFALSQHTAANLIKDSDVILFLGKLLDITIGFGAKSVIPDQAKVIQIETDPIQLGRNRGIELSLVGDIGPIVSQLQEEAIKYNWDQPGDWAQKFRDTVRSHREYLEQFITKETPLRSMFVHHTLAKQLKDDDVIVFDGGDYAYYGRAYLPAKTPRSWYYLPNLGMLGQAVPVSIAAKLARPEARVFCITGDGAFGFNAMEIDTAVRHKLKVIFLVGNDAAWGIDKNLQIGLYGKPVITDLAHSRYDLVAQGLGAHGELVESPEELEPALLRAINCEGPALLNIIIQSQISPRAQAVVENRKAGGGL